MKARLAEREERLAKLARQQEQYQVRLLPSLLHKPSRAMIQEKLASLEDLVMRLLGEKGALKAYYQLPPTRAPLPAGGPSSLPSVAGSVANGEAEPLSPDSALGSPNLPSTPSLPPLSPATRPPSGRKVGAGEGEEAEEDVGLRLVVRPPSPPSSVASRHQDEKQDPTAERILRQIPPPFCQPTQLGPFQALVGVEAAGRRGPAKARRQKHSLQPLHGEDCHALSPGLHLPCPVASAMSSMPIVMSPQSQSSVPVGREMVCRMMLGMW